MIMKKIVKLFVLIFPLWFFAHPMPNSVIELGIQDKEIGCMLKIPVKELKLAVSFDLTPKNLNIHNRALVDYLNKHFYVTDMQGKNWKKILVGISTATSEQDATKKYEEISAQYRLVPTDGNLRQFVINNTAVMHQVVSHRCMVVVGTDWETGNVDGSWREVGVMAYDEGLGTVPPLELNLEGGSNWVGFKSMVVMGVQHIAEGTDHLMFLLVLLLTTPLVAIRREWRAGDRNDRPLVKILKITLAFTVGHSLTLILATLGIVKFPTRWVEVLIAFSILVTALHTIVPLFPKREVLVAAGFGLIHGLAFSTVLAELHLGSWRLALSLLGFNLGIEAMQIFVIMLVMPWLIYLSKFPIYTALKDIIAILAGIAAVTWIMERVSGREYFLSRYLTLFSENSILFVVFLAAVSLIMYLVDLNKNKSESEQD